MRPRGLALLPGKNLPVIGSCVAAVDGFVTIDFRKLVATISTTKLFDKHNTFRRHLRLVEEWRGGVSKFSAGFTSSKSPLLALFCLIFTLF